MRYEIETVDRFKLIRVNGNIENETDAKLFDDEISNLIERGCRRFVFELNNARYLDNAGISIFIRCLCSVEKKRGSVFIIALDEEVRKVLEMVGLDRLIQTFDSKYMFFEAQGVMC